MDQTSTIPSVRRSRRTSLGALSMLTLGALILAACGGGEEATEVEEPPAPPPVEEPEAEPDAQPEPEPEPEEPEAADPGDAELVWTASFSEDGKDSVNVIAVHPDGERLLVGVDSTYLVQAADGYVLDAIGYWYPSVDDLDVSPDGELVGVGVSLGGVFLTTPDGETPAGLEALDSYTDYDAVSFHGGYDSNLAFSPDGVHLASGNRSGEVWVYDLTTASQVATFSVDDPDYLSFLEYHPSGDLLAAVDFNCRVDLWDTATGELVLDTELGTSGCYTTRPLAFSPDGEVVGLAVREDATEFVRIASVDGFTPVLDLEMDVRNLGDLAFSPDSSMLATAAWNLPPTVWDTQTGAALFSLDTGRDDVGSGNRYNPVTVAFTPDGGHVAVGYQDGTLELWRLPGVEPLVAPERTSCEPLPLPGDVLFDTGSAALKADADEALTALAEQLEAGFTDATLTFVGHTDSRGDAAANQQLSLERAEAVRDWFAGWASDQGIDGWVLEVEGRGDSELKVADVARTGEFLPGAGAINRRVEIEIDADACA